MIHYPGHKREELHQWLDDGAPDTATVEVKYEEYEVPAEQMLRDFVFPGCSDTMPKSYCDDVAGLVGWDGQSQGLTYGLAATVLLAERYQEGAGSDLLEAVAGVREDFVSI